MIDLDAELKYIDQAIAETRKLGEESRRYATQTQKPDRWFPIVMLITSMTIGGALFTAGALLAKSCG